ncbi:Mu transposase C-terminal domain-containing protein [Geomonas subterranea]|uniref:Mu transposase C-terminal domain-containing protein n=1 Tax=Geomonas subterranea TaxID=2847989 RepID=UPI001CD51A37|nr:Mu transposase C-terminal domain-containing protein [Geomonas fuzhouensis]
MPRLIKGMILQWVSESFEKDANESTSDNHKDLLEVILYVMDEQCIVIQLNGEYKLPYTREISEVESALINGGAINRRTHPNAKIICADEEYQEKHGHIRDRAWELIKDIVEDEPNIYFSHWRGRLVKSVVKKYNVTKSEVYKFLYRYWIGGSIKNALLPQYDRCGAPGKDRVISPEDASDNPGKSVVKRGRPNKKTKINEELQGVNVTEEDKRIFKIAINLYYNKQGKRPLKAAYRKMTVHFYSVGERVERGVVVKVMPPSHTVPTYEQFRYWHNKLQDFDKTQRRRSGENQYNLTARAILGDSTKMADGPGGFYQLDATIADIYLVSLLDPTRIIGRPTVYFVKDVFTRLIVGMYVGLESPSWTAAMMAIANTTTDKVAFCAEYGIEISEYEWPCRYLCEKFLADGGELLSINSDYLIAKLNIGVANCPPYRGDLKAIIERQFGTTNEKVIEWLPGAVHKIPHVRDHRLDATLNIHQFIRIIIVMVLEHNQCQWLEDYHLDRAMMADNVDPIPIKLWNWGIINRSGHLREKTQDVVKLALMPQGTASVTEKGIYFKKMYYTCDLALREQWYVKARVKGRWTVTISYDKRKADVIYLINKDKTFEPCKLVDADARFEGASVEEVEDFFEIQDIKSKVHETVEMQSTARLHGMIEAELANAKARANERFGPKESKSKRIKKIPDNRKVAKQQAREKEAFDLRPPKQNAEPAKVLSFFGEKKDEPKVRTAGEQKMDLLATIKESEKGDS